MKDNLPEYLLRRRRDYYYLKAKDEKYRSRAAYKLLQAVSKYGFIKDGNVVVDLGAAPGGWLQVSRRIVGEKGFIIGVDQRTIKPVEYPNVYTMLGDIMDDEIIARIKAVLPRPADVVISDVAPNVSGVWDLDHARQIELARRSLEIAKSLLAPRGNFFVKVFQGDLLSDFLREVKEHFSVTRLVKPKASRSESAELYLLGLEYKGNIKF